MESRVKDDHTNYLIATALKTELDKSIVPIQLIQAHVAPCAFVSEIPSLTQTPNVNIGVVYQ